MSNSTNTTDATRGQALRTRVETRKRELEATVASLAASDSDRRELEDVLTQVQGLLTGDLDHIPRVVAAELSAWLEASKHLDERHQSGGARRTGFVGDLDAVAVGSQDFRRVVFTSQHCQLVVMTLAVGEAIGAEVHELDQLFRVEQGYGEAILDGVRTAIRPGFAVLIPAGVRHDIVNTGREPLRLSTVYAPPEHRDGVVHHTRADADKDDEAFDGQTTEQPARGLPS